MQVNTSYASYGLLGLNTSTTSSSTGTSLTSVPQADSVSVNGYPVAGLPDYTALASSGTWQFDLTSALNPPTAGLPTQEVSPDDAKQAEKDITEAFKYIDAKDYAGARALANGILAKNKTNAAAYQVLGYADLGEKQFASAEQLFLKAHALDPTVGYDQDADNARLLQKDDRTVLARARSLVYMPGQRSEGIRLLISLTDRSPDNTDARLLLGDALLDDGDGNNGLMQFSAAVRTAKPEELRGVQTRLEQLVKEAPQASFVRTLMGKLALRQERYDDALTQFREAQRLSEDGGPTTDMAAAYIGIGRQRLADGQLLSAMSNFEQAQELAPTNRDVKEALGEGYIRTAEVANKNHDYSTAANKLALAADTLGKYGSKDLRTRGAAAAYTAGRALQTARIAAGDDIDTEVLAFQAAYDLDKDSETYRDKLAETRNAIGDAYLADGKYESAAYAYRRAYQLDDSNDTYKQNTINAFIAYGDDRLYNLNYTQAVNAYKEAFKIDTDNTTSRGKLANAYTRRGADYEEQEDWRNAMKDYKEALHLLPDDATYQANYNRLRGWDY
jgi:tetratricopeptide (TPR) repeat protein